MAGYLLKRDHLLIQQAQRQLRIVNYLVISTLFLTSYVFFRAPFEFYLFYVPILILLPVFISKIPFSRSLFVFFILLGISGLYGILAENNTFPNFIKVYASIIIIYSFYFYAIAYNQFRIKNLFLIYLHLCKILAFIGIIQLVSFYIGFTPGYDFRWILNKYSLVASEGSFRLSSIISEPSQYAFVLAPAIFVSLYSVLNRNFQFISLPWALIIITTTILTYSTHAYIVLLFGIMIIIMKNFNFIKSLVLIILVSIGVIFLYNNVHQFQIRVDDTVLILKDAHRLNEREFLVKLNTSNFTLLNNAVISLNAFEQSPLVGNGLGSHPVSFDKFSITRQRYLPFEDFNQMDANSLFLRLLSELGLLGVGTFIYILIRYRVGSVKDTNAWIVSHAILTMMIAALLREGHYFISGVPLFLFMYIYLKKYGFQ